MRAVGMLLFDAHPHSLEHRGWVSEILVEAEIFGGWILEEACSNERSVSAAVGARPEGALSREKKLGGYGGLEHRGLGPLGVGLEARWVCRRDAVGRGVGRF